METKYYKEYFKLEREHWWFKARLKLLKKLSEKYAHKNATYKILNAGAATGATSEMLNSIGEVTSLEYDKDCSEFLSEILQEEVINESLTDLSFSNQTFDMVCAFDVIEHIDDDEKAISEIYRILKQDGCIFLTVPAFNILWSKHDEINHHYRRYMLSELKNKLIKHGFKIEYSTYFNFYLFLPILIVRLLSKIFKTKNQKETTGSDFEKFNSYPTLNKILYKIFASEIFFLKKQIPLPFGVSALVIGRKNS